MSDPLVDHVRRKHLIKKRAFEDSDLRERFEQQFEPGDEVEVVKSAKSSPLIDRSENPVRPPGAPPNQPLSGSGRTTGSPIPPAGGVDSSEHSHDHTHVGSASDSFEAARWGAYRHSHPHDHAVRRNPDDRSVETHDNAAHFAIHRAMVQKTAQLRKMAKEHPDAQVRRGAQQLLKGKVDPPAQVGHVSGAGVSKMLEINARLTELQAKASIEPGQAATPAPGAPPASRGVTSPSGGSAGYCPNRSCSCGGCGPSCTGDCCVACTMADDLDRRETMHFSAVAELVKEAQHWQRYADESRDFHGREYAREKVKAIAARLRNSIGLDDETIIRKFAERARPRQTPEPAIVRKAAALDSFVMTPELAKTIRGAVTKAFEDLGTRIEALNERAGGSRERL